jgi:hypothetical protein
MLISSVEAGVSQDELAAEISVTSPLTCHGCSSNNISIPSSTCISSMSYAVCIHTSSITAISPYYLYILPLAIHPSTSKPAHHLPPLLFLEQWKGAFGC